MHCSTAVHCRARKTGSPSALPSPLPSWGSRGRSQSLEPVPTYGCIWTTTNLATSRIASGDSSPYRAVSGFTADSRAFDRTHDNESGVRWSTQPGRCDPQLAAQPQRGGFLGVWERLNNPSFNPVEFDGIRMQTGLNSFVLTPKQWIQKTGAVGRTSSAGRYGGAFAHKDIPRWRSQG